MLLFDVGTLWRIVKEEQALPLPASYVVIMIMIINIIITFIITIINTIIIIYYIIISGDSYIY